ncbi:MAG: hypothetical protein R6U17_05110 [Thermoplasmata archaeon]
MIDYIMSKMAWIMVAVILTASVIGVYQWQSSSTDELYLDEATDLLSDTINHALSISGDFILNMTYEEESDSYMVLDHTIKGEPYSLYIDSRSITIHCGNRISQRKLIGNVRLLDPFLLGRNHTRFPSSRDAQDLSLPSGTPFVIESKTIGGIRDVYIYPDDGGESRDLANVLYQDMKDFINWHWDGNNESVEYRNRTTFHHNITFLRSHISPSHDVPVPFGTPTLNLSISGVEQEDYMVVPAETELFLNRTLVEDGKRFSIEYRVETDSPSG